MAPQFEGKAPYAAIRYREMLNSFYDAVKGVSNANKVVTAGTAPYGDPPGGARTRPLTCWRQVFCLRGRSHLQAKKCPSAARFDILAHHPMNTSGGPTRSAINPNDASTPDFKNVVAILRAAERQHTVDTPGRHPAWATELWWDSNPPDNVEGVSLKTQARWLQQALYILWKQGAEVVINLQVQDGPFDPQNPYSDDSTGIFFADGTPKPSFTAWRFPFVTDPSARRRLIAWGKAPVAGRLAIQVKRRGNWRKVESFRVKQGGVFRRNLRLQGRHKLRATVAGETSLVWVQR